MAGKITIQANIDIDPEALETIVKNAKHAAGADLTGVYRVDTAGKVNELITRFLEEKDFLSYVQDKSKYP
jgi:hypothetical protein